MEESNVPAHVNIQEVCSSASRASSAAVKALEHFRTKSAMFPWDFKNELIEHWFNLLAFCSAFVSRQ